MQIEVNRGHVNARALTRTSMDSYMIAAMNAACKRVKARKVPNGDWYIPAYKDKQIIGWICGRGCYIATILAPSMVPKGIRL